MHCNDMKNDEVMVYFEEEITVKNILWYKVLVFFLVLIWISKFLIVLSSRQNYDVISVRHQRVVLMKNKNKKKFLRLAPLHTFLSADGTLLSSPSVILTVAGEARAVCE